MDDRGLTQAELARRSKTTTATISRILSAGRQSPLPPAGTDIYSPCGDYTTVKEQMFLFFRPYFSRWVVIRLLRMEIIPQVAEAFVSGVSIGALVFAAMAFTVMLSQIIAQAVDVE